jgi:2-hydroxychromene-2-carboxylate isomerase
MKLTWYFDFISPFAYIQHCQFDRLPDNVEVEYKPILLAGLLNYWNNVGPAEIEPKRIFTYKHCYWLAKKNNIPFKMPPAHPFNSLNALRLAIAMGNQPDAIQTIFETIWKQGLSLEAEETLQYLEDKLEVTDLAAMIMQPSVKDKLRQNTEEAASQSVFGVPTFMPTENSKEIFWGLDAFDMLLDYIQDPVNFNDQEMKRIETLPIGVQRKK